MNATKFSFAPDQARLQRVLWEEFDAFRNDFNIMPVPEIQDLRGLLIAWFCTFVPEVVTPTFSGALRRHIGEVRVSKDFQVEGWWRNLLMDVAAFGLTGDTDYLEICRLNLDHHKQVLRTFLLRSLALAAPRLSFSDEELRKRVFHNLSISHLLCEWHAVLLLVAQGDKAEKRRELERWLQECRLNPCERELLEGIRQTGHCHNAFFLEHFLRAASYMALRLCSVPVPSVSADSDPDLGSTNLFGESMSKDFATLYWQRVGEHPLTKFHIMCW